MIQYWEYSCRSCGLDWSAVSDGTNLCCPNCSSVWIDAVRELTEDEFYTYDGPESEQ